MSKGVCTSMFRLHIALYLRVAGCEHSAPVSPKEFVPILADSRRACRLTWPPSVGLCQSHSHTSRIQNMLDIAIPVLTAGACTLSLTPLLRTQLLQSSQAPAIPVIQRFGQIQGQLASGSGERDICR